MIKYISYVLLACPLFLSAQEQASPQQLLNNKISVNDYAPVGFSASHHTSESVAAYYSASLPQLVNPQVTLRLKHQTTSIIGTHFFFEQLYKGKPVYGAFLKVNLDKKGKQLSMMNALVQINNDAADETNSTHWVQTSSGLSAAILTSNGPQISLHQPDGAELISIDTRLYLTQDTIIRAKVFNPDPLTTAGKIYGEGGTYRHFNDSDYALLNDERVEVSMPATFRNDSFYLENQYAVITNIAYPNIDAVVQKDPAFFFTRKQNEFKQVMALYHIYKVQELVQSLGFTAVPWQLRVDPLAGMADQSFFSSSPDTTLQLGLGGVPDAEDADVIVHEFTHAISFSLNPNGVISTERRAIEEAMCDVMACAYSRKLNPFKWREVFNWDGHNEFWGGRNGNTSKTYADKIDSYYSDSEIWTSTLNDVIEEMGEDYVIKLMLATIPSLTPTSTMPEAAMLFYQADSILFGGTSQWKFGKYFNARLLGDFPTGLYEQHSKVSRAVYNSAAFANGSGDATLLFPATGNYKIEVFDLNGRRLLDENISDDRFILRSDLFGKGLYMVHLSGSNGETEVIKLVRY